MLTELDLVCEGGELTAVIGRVGAGKSSLLSAILGEMGLARGGGVAIRQQQQQQQGEPSKKTMLAFVPQQSWIQNLSLRDNVLFGRDHDDEQYSAALDGCALRDDLLIMPGGDLAEIGENGINLSGGQKQRVSLARAAYSGASVFLLDDPLSAVDAHVGKHLFDELIGPRGMLAGRTRVLVTHNLSFLDQMDKIVLLDEGRIVASGKYEDLKRDSQEFRDFVSTALAEEETRKAEEEKEEAKDTEFAKETDALLDKDAKKGRVGHGGKDEEVSAPDGGAAGKIVEEEVSARGRVDFKHYIYFIKKTNAYIFSFLMLMLLVAEGVRYTV